MSVKERSHLQPTLGARSLRHFQPEHQTRRQPLSLGNVLRRRVEVGPALLPEVRVAADASPFGVGAILYRAGAAVAYIATAIPDEVLRRYDASLRPLALN